LKQIAELAVARDRSIEKIYGENDELYEENKQL